MCSARCRFRGRGIGAHSPALAALVAAGGIAGIGVDASAAMHASSSAPDPAAVSTHAVFCFSGTLTESDLAEAPPGSPWAMNFLVDLRIEPGPATVVPLSTGTMRQNIVGIELHLGPTLNYPMMPVPDGIGAETAVINDYADTADLFLLVLGDSGTFFGVMVAWTDLGVLGDESLPIPVPGGWSQEDSGLIGPSFSGTVETAEVKLVPTPGALAVCIASLGAASPRVRRRR